MISEFPLFLFTTLGGAAAGMYVFAALFPTDKDEKRPWLMPLVSLVLLAIGLVGVLGHLGRPELFLNAFANPSAGITQEAYASCAFGVVILVDLIASWRMARNVRALKIVGAIVGIVLAFVMGFAYSVNYGTPAWVAWPTVPLFVLGDLLMGAALYAALVRRGGLYGSVLYAGAIVAISALLAVAIAFEAMHFQAVGFSAVPFMVALVIGPAASAAFALVGHKSNVAWAPVAVVACAVIGVCIARWFFYAGSIL